MSPEELAALVEHGYCSPHQPSVLSWRCVGKIADAREDLVGDLVHTNGLARPLVIST